MGAFKYPQESVVTGSCCQYDLQSALSGVLKEQSLPGSRFHGRAWKYKTCSEPLPMGGYLEASLLELYTAIFAFVAPRDCQAKIAV